MNILFVCSRNKIRSVTGERIYARHPQVTARSAGTADSARHKINASDIRWADLIFVFENRHQHQIRTKFGTSADTDKIVVLDIADEYKLMDAELIEEIIALVEPYLVTEAERSEQG